MKEVTVVLFCEKSSDPSVRWIKVAYDSGSKWPGSDEPIQIEKLIKVPASVRFVNEGEKEEKVGFKFKLPTAMLG